MECNFNLHKFILYKPCSENKQHIHIKQILLYNTKQ